MPRTKAGTTRKARHNKVLDQTKGFRGTNNRLYKRAKEALLHAGMYAYIGRKLRKRDMRRLWIVRINAALKQVDENLQYSRFIKSMKDSKVAIDRKMLAELAVSDFTTFTKVVQAVRQA
ncbi:MAG: 50S ribosomal protein L20 [Candidatus Pacebacteria bacterium CG_4_10_14_0_8_um_filter_43_12]|nr:MAG: 50S ribosomal protein L20 [Candidatus Pacebacteria bacterium CG10_big_fil_rev_8_21_14_0_10_44_11]PIY79221.1 MAG: 50S ribosomal protein L20 [Candidatus Pacebacteria bacterium CG_4_10_14_0_8_um_filter_43_12]